MSNYIYGITTAEIMSIFVCVILLCYCVFEKRGQERTRRDRLFVLLLVSCIAALVADALSWILDGNIRLLPVLYICTTLATLMSFVLICEFIIFLTAYIREKQEITLFFEYIYMAFTLVASIFVIVTAADGKLFTYENGVYVDGPWYTAYIIINIVAMMLSLVVFFTYRKSLSRHDFIATLPYIALPCIAAAINAIVPEFSYAYPAVTLALVVVYIMLQINDEIQKEINARKALEYAKIAAESANRAKTAFLFNMSHDIRTPMNAIIGFNNIALSHIDDKDTVVNSLKKVGTSSKQLLSLINDVLDMSRIESGSVKSEYEPTDIVEEAGDLMEIIKQSTQKVLNIHIDFSGVAHKFVMTDRLHTDRILTNVLSNSIKYTPEGGTIHCIIRETPASRDNCYGYDFIIEDNGIGMSEEFLEHIYEEFSREKTSTASGVQGTGLGMAITKKLVDLLGGTIEIQSKLGEGTKTTIHLEMEAADPDSVSAESTSIRGEIDVTVLKDKKVLLVEDNELNREIAEDILTDEGMIVDTAEDGDIAVEKMKNAEIGQYDIVLMDIQMPRMNGYEATKAIRNLPSTYASTIPIVAMTANAFEEDKQNAVDSGMNGHLAKPIEIPKLLEMLSRFL